LKKIITGYKIEKIITGDKIEKMEFFHKFLINNRNSGTEETQKLRKLPGSFKFDENNLGRR
jgi:hypothetical protein